jgi:hypothetical protein
MELAAADIHPHVVVGDHQIGIARQAERHDVEQARQLLARDADVDMLEVNRITDILG